MARPVVLGRPEFELLSMGDGRADGWTLGLRLEEKLSRNVRLRLDGVVCCPCQRASTASGKADIRTVDRRRADLPKRLFPASHHLTGDTRWPSKEVSISKGRRAFAAAHLFSHHHCTWACYRNIRRPLRLKPTEPMGERS